MKFECCMSHDLIWFCCSEKSKISKSYRKKKSIQLELPLEKVWKFCTFFVIHPLLTRLDRQFFHSHFRLAPNIQNLRVCMNSRRTKNRVPFSFHFHRKIAFQFSRFSQIAKWKIPIGQRLHSPWKFAFIYRCRFALIFESCEFLIESFCDFFLLSIDKRHNKRWCVGGGRTWNTKMINRRTHHQSHWTKQTALRRLHAA